MKLLPDIIQYIENAFPAEQRPVAMELLQSAVLEDGRPASPRCQRAALVGSGGSIEELNRLVSMLKVDFRDVIVAGEYEDRGGSFRQVRDLNAPFPTGDR